jgi:hypothetical protein
VHFKPFFLGNRNKGSPEKEADRIRQNAGICKFFMGNLRELPCGFAGIGKG